MKDFRLSVAEHVARRETQRFFNDAVSRADHLSIFRDVCNQIAKRYVKGRKLTESDFKDIRVMLDDMLEAVRPQHLIVKERPATRTRPKGEAVEYMLVFVASPSREGGSMSFAQRIFVSRKTLILDTMPVPQVERTHLLHRAIERDILGGDIDRIATAIFDTYGLGILWQYAVESDHSPNDQVVLPLGEGLMLGQAFIERPDKAAPAKRVAIKATGLLRQPLERHPLGMTMSHPPSHSGPAIRCLENSTIISPDLFFPEQELLHARLSAFSRRYKPALDEITSAVLWPGSEIDRAPSYEAIKPAVDHLVEELAEIINDPDIEMCLRKGEKHLVRTEVDPDAGDKPLAPAM